MALDLVFDLVFFVGLGFGSLLVSDLVCRYSDLNVPILVLISLSSFISSSVACYSSGNGIVDLLYSNLSFQVIWVNLWIM